MDIIEKPQKKIVSFKEVHKELELEAQFVNKEHDVTSFKQKGEFLNNVGFGNSIATKIYNDISTHSERIKRYKEKYPFHKFIFKSQLMRICEKYDLYVRSPQLYIGDIPTKNIDDMRNFKIDPFDCFDGVDFFSDTNDKETLSIINRFEHLFRIRSTYTHKISLDEFFNRLNSVIETNTNETSSIQLFENKIGHTYDIGRHDPIIRFIKQRMESTLEIAAVKTMFNPKAFELSESRIINEPELEAKSQVDLDPIVLMKVNGGYLIITAWGDEANDELVVNQVLN